MHRIIRRAGALCSLTMVMAVSASASNVSTRDNRAPCRNCIQNETGSAHWCASGECEGGDICFHSCDHTGGESGTCFSQHDHCPHLFGGAADLYVAVDTENFGSILGALATNPAGYSYNAARAAIQIYDCEGNVIEHIPVTGAVTAVLAE